MYYICTMYENPGGRGHGLLPTPMLPLQSYSGKFDSCSSFDENIENSAEKLHNLQKPLFQSRNETSIKLRSCSVFLTKALIRFHSGSKKMLNSSTDFTPAPVVDHLCCEYRIEMQSLHLLSPHVA